MKLQENVRYDFNWKTFSGNLRTLYTPNEKNRFRLSIGGKSSFSEGDAKGSIPMGGGNRRYSLITQISYTGQLNDQLQFLTVENLNMPALKPPTNRIMQKTC